MKVRGLENVELVGEIAGLHESDGYLIMNVGLSKPVGWQARIFYLKKNL